MISKQNILEYLDQLVKLELEMSTSYKNAAKHITNEKYKKIFEDLSLEEIGHEKMVEEIIEMLNKWKE